MSLAFRGVPEEGGSVKTFIGILESSEIGI